MLKCILAVCFLLAAQPSPDAVRRELAQFEGEWTMMSAERDGQTPPKNLITSAKRTCRDNVTTVMVNGQLLMKATFTVDPTKSPKTIDYRVTEGRNQGTNQLGIYELDGDKMKICFADPGRQRPTDFNTKGKNGHTLGIWKRERK
jgi:uncharacterized protein (TIGR03067 family)